MLFSGRHKSGQLDLEAVEMAVRAAVHQATAELEPPEDVQWIVDVDPVDML